LRTHKPTGPPDQKKNREDQTDVNRLKIGRGLSGSGGGAEKTKSYIAVQIRARNSGGRGGRGVGGNRQSRLSNGIGKARPKKTTQNKGRIMDMKGSIKA